MGQKVNYKKMILAGIFIPVTVMYFYSIAPILVGRITTVTDIDSPQFTPRGFNFSSYTDAGDLHKVLQGMFPENTEKSFVDQIMIDSAGATSKDLGNNLFVYRHSAKTFVPFFLVIDCPMKWNIRIQFDSDQKLKSIQGPIGPCI